MEIIRLRAEPFLTLPNYGYASVISDPQQLVVCHCHDYYEIFVVSQGSGEHVDVYKRQAFLYPAPGTPFKIKKT